MILKKYLDILMRAVMTGFCIGIGGTVYLSCSNKYIGAVLFGTGLFVILTSGFYLFTGKVGYVVNEKPDYIPKVILIWAGNFIGTAIMGFLIRQTRIKDAVAEKALAICNVKFDDNYLSIFVLAIFCGILMFIAADGYKNIKNPLGQMLAVFLPVVVFILSGYEHCIANMYYFTLAKVWSGEAFVYILVMTAGNTAGGIFIPLVKKLFVNNDNSEKKSENNSGNKILRKSMVKM